MEAMEKTRDATRINRTRTLPYSRRYIHHDRAKGIRNMAFKANDPRCILCMIVVEWLHKELIPCADADRESRYAHTQVKFYPGPELCQAGSCAVVKVPTRPALPHPHGSQVFGIYLQCLMALASMGDLATAPHHATYPTQQQHMNPFGVFGVIPTN